MRKTISISRQVKKELDEFCDGRSVNKGLKDLLENVTPKSNDFEDGRVNINMDEVVYDKLVSCRVYYDEPFSSVLHRILSDRK